VSTADGFSQPLAMRVALLALTGKAALQGVYFLLAAEGPTRVVGTVRAWEASCAGYGRARTAGANSPRRQRWASRYAESLPVII